MQKKIIKTKNRYIKTKIPAPGTASIMRNLNKFESRSMHGQLPIAWSKAKNFNIYDIKGNKFIDFTSTIFVANIGHANPKLIANLKKTLNNNFVHSYAYIHKIRETYIKKLVKFAGKNFEKAFLMSSGTEATEAALKLMRLYGQKRKKRRLGIICFEGNWHGRTMGAQLMSGNSSQKKWIGFKDKDIHHLSFPYPWKVNEKNAESYLELSIKKLKKHLSLSKDICGVMIETFQGWGAIHYPKNYIKKLEKICRLNNILISFDEIQTGFGRTGYNFGFKHYGVEPDLICCAKGMGGGIPISGVIGKKSIMDLPEIGSMSSTNSANPLSCSAGIAVIEEIKKKNLIYQSKKKGEIIRKYLQLIKDKNKIDFEIYGSGLYFAIVFDPLAKGILKKLKMLALNCMKDGLLVVYTGRESVKIGPPLTITKDALKEGLGVLKKNIEKIFL